MPRWGISFLLLVGVVASGANAQSAPAQSGPRVSVENELFDFGTRLGQAPLHHAFQLRNIGGAPLRIDKVVTSCGCTTTGDWERLVAPGAFWEVPIIFDPTGREGAITQTVRVTTNDPQVSEVVFHLTGVVVPRFRFEPATRRIIFDQLRPGENRGPGLSQSLRIALLTDEPIRLGTPQVAPPLFTAKLQRGPTTQPATSRPVMASSQPTTAPAVDYELIVSPADTLPAGTHQATVRISTGLPDEPEIEVLVVAIVTPSLVLSPPELLVPAQRPAVLRRPLMLRNNGDAPISIAEVRVSCPGVTTEVETVTPGRLFRVWVSIPADPLPAGGCTVTVQTDSPGAAPLISRIVVQGP